MSDADQDQLAFERYIGSALFAADKGKHTLMSPVVTADSIAAIDTFKQLLGKEHDPQIRGLIACLLGRIDPVHYTNACAVGVVTELAGVLMDPTVSARTMKYALNALDLILEHEKAVAGDCIVANGCLPMIKALLDDADADVVIAAMTILSTLAAEGHRTAVCATGAYQAINRILRTD